MQLGHGRGGSGVAHQGYGRERRHDAGFLVGLVALERVGRQGQALGQGQGGVGVFGQIMHENLGYFFGL